MVQAKYPAKPIFTKVPANWTTMTPEEKKAVTDEMAKEIQRRLGVKPKG